MKHSCISRITGVGSYLPSQVIKNDDFTTMMDTSDEWIQKRTGIKERRWVDQASSTCTSDLALEASQRAMDAAGITKDDLDMILLATLSPDHSFPGTACFLQAKLGLSSGIPALDVRQQCAGFIFGLSIADQYIKTGTCKNILLVGSEVVSKGLNKTTEGRDVAVLFGDGAGAVVVSAADKTPENLQDKSAPHIISTHIHTDGRFAKDLWVEQPSMATPQPYVSIAKVESGGQYAKMNGKSVFTNATRRLPEALQEAVNKAGFKMSDVDLFVLHQANMRINEMVAKQLEIPEEKVFNTIDRFGNTTAATIPIGLDEAIKAGKLKPGMLVASAAFGSGFVWGSALIRW